MIIKHKINLGVLGLIFIIVFTGCGKKIRNYSIEDRFASIFPDYNNIVIPPNIAPLNFYIKEKGSKFQVEIYSKNGDKLVINQVSAKIEIPVGAWQKLLKHNVGNNIFIDIYCKKEKWVKYTTLTDSIAGDPIDSYLSYRLINNTYLFWGDMGIYQRNLENFDESTIFSNSSSNKGCVNCHSFCKANPKKMLIHFRRSYPGTLILNDDKITKINSTTKYTMSPFVYPSWHPGGNYIAYSVNLINLYFSTNRDALSEVSDQASDIVLYKISTNSVITSPKISTRDRENLPTWSPDGKWLYYISAPEAQKGNLTNRNMAKYSLLRIPFDTATNTFGNVDTLLSSRKTGKSISFPIISPDGRYVLFCMLDHGYFTVFDKFSDLYILDLKNNNYHKLNINSSSNENYHGWSQNGRWIVFNSRRLDDIYSTPFFAYFDRNGNTYKPFVLPQKDPLFYNTFLKHYNRPEFITGKVKLNSNQIRDLIYSDAHKVKFDSSVDVDALSGATWIASHKQ